MQIDIQPCNFSLPDALAATWNGACVLLRVPGMTMSNMLRCGCAEAMQPMDVLERTSMLLTA